MTTFTQLLDTFESTVRAHEMKGALVNRAERDEVEAAYALAKRHINESARARRDAQRQVGGRCGDGLAAVGEASPPAALYVVRHVATGAVLPPILGRRGRGGSFWDPANKDYFSLGIPRIFHNRHAAQCFIASWARGEHHTYRSKGDMYAGIDPEEETVIQDVGRSNDMLVAVPIEITYLTEDPK